jgi:hypothetical protein
MLSYGAKSKVLERRNFNTPPLPQRHGFQAL